MKLALIGSFDAIIDSNISKYIHQTNLRHLVLGGEKGIKTEAEIWATNNDVPIVYIAPDYLLNEENAELIARTKLINHADEIIYFNTNNGDCDLEYVKTTCENKNKPLTVHNFPV